MNITKSESSVKKQEYLVDEWLKDLDFSWLRKGKKRTRARCAICNKTL